MGGGIGYRGDLFVCGKFAFGGALDGTASEETFVLIAGRVSHPGLGRIKKF
jgi:hypothetical protein